MSQERLAEQSGLHPTYISDVERGKVNASVYSFFLITNALGVSLADVVSAPVGKGNKELEKEMAVVTGLIRGLDKKNRTIIFSAIRGILSALGKGQNIE